MPHTLNIIDYLEWRADVPFDIAPFNPVDNLVLSQFSYMKMEGMAGKSLCEAARAIASAGTAPDNDLRLCGLLAQSRRFADARILRCEERLDEHIEMQFAAAVIELGDGTACVVFRGTDSTLVGWKEDLNMSFADEVPSQAAAVRFLNESIYHTRLPLRVMGHSKGGNLAVYSSALCLPDVQSSIIAVYNNDGPGLIDSVMDSPGYERIEARVNTYLPQSSVIGMLLNHPESYQVIHADGSLGILQHDPYAWETRRDHFNCEGGLRRGSLYTDRAIKDWVKDIPNEKRKEFIDAVYAVLQATHARTLNDLSASWGRSAVAILAAMSKLEPETRHHIHAVIGALISACAKNIRIFPQQDAEKPRIQDASDAESALPEGELPSDIADGVDAEVEVPPPTNA